MVVVGLTICSLRALPIVGLSVARRSARDGGVPDSYPMTLASSLADRIERSGE